MSLFELYVFLLMQLHFFLLNVLLLLSRYIVVSNDAFYVFGAAIANFDVTFVENTVKFIIFWEVLI